MSDQQDHKLLKDDKTISLMKKKTKKREVVEPSKLNCFTLSDS